MNQVVNIKISDPYRLKYVVERDHPVAVTMNIGDVSDQESKKEITNRIPDSESPAKVKPNWSDTGATKVSTEFVLNSNEVQISSDDDENDLPGDCTSHGKKEVIDADRVEKNAEDPTASKLLSHLGETTRIKPPADGNTTDNQSTGENREDREGIKRRKPLHLQSASSGTPLANSSQPQSPHASADRHNTINIQINLEDHSGPVIENYGPAGPTGTASSGAESSEEEEKSRGPVLKIANKDAASSMEENKSDPATNGLSSEEMSKEDPAAPLPIVVKKEAHDPTAPAETPPWTAGQHRSFVSAVFEIGLKNCSPSVIMEAMKNLPSDINREKTKSHLQKFRKTSDRSVDEFMEEFDAFLELVGGQKQEAAPRQSLASDGPLVTDIKKRNEQEALILADAKFKKEEEGSNRNEKEPAALLEAALAGMDPDELLGGTAAAHAAFSVANNCPVKETLNKIPYESSKEDFPVLSEAERKSSIGQSLIKVKGALKFVTEFVLKTRHGIPMKLDKQMPPFLEKQDIVMLVPSFAPERKGGTTAPSGRQSVTQAQRGGPQPANPPAFPNFPPPPPHTGSLHPGYSQGYAPGGIPQQPGYFHHSGYFELALPGGPSMVYPSSYGVPTPVATMYPLAPTLPNPYLGQSVYPSSIPQQQMIPGPYGTNPHLLSAAAENQYAPSHGYPSQHDPYHQSHHPGGYAYQQGQPHYSDLQQYGQNDPWYGDHQQQQASMDVPTVSYSSMGEQQHHHHHHHHQSATDDTRRARSRRGSEDSSLQKGRRRHRHHHHDSSPRPSLSPHDNSNLKNIFDTTPPSTQRSSSSNRQTSADRAPPSLPRSSSARDKSRSRSRHSTRSRNHCGLLDQSPASPTPKHDPGNDALLVTSPIQRNPSSSSSKRTKKRDWASLPSSPGDGHQPCGSEDERQSKRPREGIFRMNIGVTSPSKTNDRIGPGDELERPGSTLSFTVEELGLHHPNAGTPNSAGEAGVSPMSLALQDILWNPLAIDSGDHHQRNKNVLPRQQHRPSRPQLFSPSGDSTRTNTPRQSPSATPVDQVALDFGMKVPTPSRPDEEDTDAKDHH